MFDRLESARPGGARANAPTRDQIDPAAEDLIGRYGPAILRTARRFSSSAEDAEDAYQRGLEILLTKAPSIREDDLLPWLKTVVKHEAFAIRRQRDRADPIEQESLEAAPGGSATHEQAEQRERLRTGAEAMRRLKPHEMRCLLLLAEGFSYKQICEETGWTYTKVNRCLTEGRRAFLTRIGEIESGAECERLSSVLSAIADGEATGADVRAARRHLRGCPGCRATLAAYRSAPSQVAALVPPAIALADEGSRGFLLRWLSAVSDWIQERVYGCALKVQGAAEMASANKAVVAASTVALAGGGVGAVATLEPLDHWSKRAAPKGDPQAPGGPAALPKDLHPRPLKGITRIAGIRRGRAAPRTRRAPARSGHSPTTRAVPTGRPRPAPPNGSESLAAPGGEFARPETSSSQQTSASSSSSNEFSGLAERFPLASRSSSGSSASAASSRGSGGGGEFGD